MACLHIEMFSLLIMKILFVQGNILLLSAAPWACVIYVHDQTESGK